MPTGMEWIRNLLSDKRFEDNSRTRTSPKRMESSNLRTKNTKTIANAISPQQT